MKKILLLAIMVVVGLTFCCCTSDGGSDEGSKGSIYGIVTASDTGEPLPSKSISLFKADARGDYSLLLSTTTFADGHFEFIDLEPGRYAIQVDRMSFYLMSASFVVVEAGRQARIDVRT